MTVDSIIKEILASRGDLTREEVLRMIEEKVKNAEGFFTDETAARIISSELGIKTAQKQLAESLIKNLVSGLNDVTVTGRVISVSPSRRFARSDGTEGFVKRIQIADKSGLMKAVLWDDKAKEADSFDIRSGQVIRLSHGYLREGFDGRIELNLGTRGEIEILPEEECDRYPPLENFLGGIAEITDKDGEVSILGVVREISPESRFERKDGSEGKMKSIRLKDFTGEIRVVFWDNKADEIENLKRGDHLKIMNAEVRNGIRGQHELHVQRDSAIENLTELPLGLDSLPSAFTKAEEITPGMRNIDILARVREIGRTAKLHEQKTGSLLKLLVEDETGSILLNLWGDKALLCNEIRRGVVLLIEGAFARDRFGRPVLNLDDGGSITINPKIEEAAKLQRLPETVTDITEIREGKCITVEGEILTELNLREVTAARDEGVKVASFELSDSTGTTEVSLWRSLAEDAEKLSTGDIIKIRNVYVRRDLSGKLSLSSGTFTSLQRLSKND
ncbi:MAG: OB-fold nucleic acid binding domain-containing protein [Candidatus Bathyarchaeia archaeon]